MLICFYYYFNNPFLTSLNPHRGPFLVLGHAARSRVGVNASCSMATKREHLRTGSGGKFERKKTVMNFKQIGTLFVVGYWDNCKILSEMETDPLLNK